MARGFAVQIGINRDIIFKGERYHIQTEDSGVKRAVISTVLFKGGLVVSSSKASYEDKLGSADIDKEVSALMQGLHKDMIRTLKNGDFGKDKSAAAVGKKAASAPTADNASEVSKPTKPVENTQGGRPLTVSEKVLENKVLELLSLK